MRRRLRSIRLLIGVAGLTLPSVSALAQQASPTPSTVQLHFAWPVGTEARVRYVKIMEREQGAPPSTVEIEGEYVVHVHPHPAGLVIEHLDPVATRFVATPALPTDDPRRAVWSTIGAPLTDWVVSEEGELLGVTREDVLLGLLVETLRPLELEEAELQVVLDELMSESELLGPARDLWRAMVGAWADTEFVMDEPQMSEAEETNPLVPSVVLSYRHEYRLAGVEDCPAPSGRCVHLHLTSFPDPRELTAVMSNALREMGLATMSFDRLIQLTRMELVTDPETLLPHAVEVSKRVDGILVADGERRVFRRSDETRLIFSY